MTTYRDEGPLYREDGTRVYPEDPAAEPVIVRRRRGGGFLTGLVLILALIVALLFYTGFWSVNVSQPGALPKLSVEASPGVLPKVDLQSKQIVIGSRKESVAVPTVDLKDGRQNGD